jgi:hypothetical protein
MTEAVTQQAMTEAVTQQVDLRLVFWLRGSSGEIGFLQYFPEFLLKVRFLHKNETPEQFC